MRYVKTCQAVLKPKIVPILLVLLIFAIPSASADELRKRFTRAVLEKLFEIGKGRAVPEFWTGHLGEAMIVTRHSQEFNGVVSDEMAACVKNILSTPERALGVIGGAEFKSTFNADAAKVFRSYIATHPPLSGPSLTRLALPLSNEVSTEAMLLVYYADQIVAEIDSMLGGRVSAAEFELLKAVREAFSKCPTREEFLAMTNDPIQTAMSQMAGRSGRFSKICSLLTRYQRALKGKRGGDTFDFFNLGLGYDSLFAEIHCGTYEKKMGAFGILLEDESCGGFKFTKRHLIEILRNPDQRFRKEAVGQFIARRQFRTETLETAVEGLLRQSLHYSPVGAEFEEVIGTVALLLQYPEEHIAKFLVDPASPPSRRIAAVRALGWLQTDTAFRSLYASYFSSVFKEASDAYPKLLEALVDAVYRCTATSSPERMEIALTFFRHLLKKDAAKNQRLSSLLYELRMRIRNERFVE